MSIKFTVLSDIHSAERSEEPGRRGEWGEILLQKAVRRLNRWLKPDAVLVLGDLIEDPMAPDAEDRLERISEILSRLTSPCLVIPGNHDGDPDRFHRIFRELPDWLDVKGVRFVPFEDEERPGYMAHRAESDLLRMKAARAGFDGMLISCQHVPMFPEGSSDCPYYLDNAGKIIEVMRESGYGLSVSGHYHKGIDWIEREGMGFLTAPSLCNAPFRFLEVDFDGRGFQVTPHQFAMPRELGLVDFHAHTPFAYCNENMDVAAARKMADAFGIAEMYFTEHSTHLYFNRSDHKQLKHLREGLAGANPADFRVEEYLQTLESGGCAADHRGLEIDVDLNGRTVVRKEDLARLPLRLGAIHELKAFMDENPDSQNAEEEFLSQVQVLLELPVHILAHPFRVFQRKGGGPAPRSLYRPLAKMLASHHVAAEMNFHVNEPEPEFLELCIQNSVKLTFGSDSHHLCQVGEFYPHLKMLEAMGYPSSFLGDILLSSRVIQRAM